MKKKINYSSCVKHSSYKDTAQPSDRNGSVGVMLLAAVVFFMDVTFRTREFEDSTSLDWQVLLQTTIVLLASVWATMNGALSIRNITRLENLIILFFVIFMIGSSLYSPAENQSLYSGIFFLLFFLFAIGLKTTLTHRQILLGIVVGLSPIVISAPIMHFLHLEAVSAKLFQGTGGDREHGLAPHPAALCSDGALLIISYYSLIKYKLSTFRVLFILYIFTAMALTTERGGVFALVGGAFFVWGTKNSSVRAIKFIILTPIIWLSLLIYWFGALAVVPREILSQLSRNGNSNDAASLTGRSEIWSFGLDLFSRSPYIGHGFNTGEYLLLDDFPGWSIVQFHSMYVQCLVYLGVVGILFLITIFIIQFRAFVFRPFIWRDWVFFYVFLLGGVEVSALGNRPEVLTLLWFLACQMVRDYPRQFELIPQDSKDADIEPA